jgi:hypothetical protein
MTDKSYWAVRCKKCSGMVGYRDVRYTLDSRGTQVEEKLPKGTVKLCCAHCGTFGVFDLHRLQPTSVKLLFPRLP